MKKPVKKMTLSRETIRNLQDESLKAAELAPL